jgi:hypothetical protein
MRTESQIASVAFAVALRAARTDIAGLNRQNTEKLARNTSGEAFCI